MRRISSATAIAGLIAVVACAGATSDPRPVPSLASSPAAAIAFDEIRQTWSSDEQTNPAALRQLLERFVVRFPTDGLIPLARVYLAIVAMRQGDLASADRQLAATEHLPPGSARDFWTVARARRLRLSGEPEAALVLLNPLLGKSVDLVMRAVFEEELTLCALATHRDYEAISYMDAWLRASPEEDKGRTLATVTSLVERLPNPVLVGTLHAMRKQRATFGYGVDIERILAGRLAKVATESGDADLARMLLDPGAGAVVIAGATGQALSELATSRRGLNVVQGRTIGLLLPTDSAELRDESADVLRGVMWALGLPRGLRGIREVPSTGSDGGPRPLGMGCAPLESAPALEEPRVDEELRLVTRDDAGSEDRTEVLLDELAGEGAAVVIAGLDPETAARAVRWGERRGVAVVALEPPAGNTQGGAFGFVLGESRGNVLAALSRAAPSIVTGPVAPIIDGSEVPAYPAAGGRAGPLRLLPPISCDIPATRAGDPRFPTATWEHDKTHAWLVSGSPRCASDVVGDLVAARLRGTVVLTLEAAAMPGHASGLLRVVSASAGVIPGEGGRDDELARFSATLGDVTWWTALGRDSATLARVAMAQLPTDEATDSRTVADRRARARDLLATARARLWTTEKTGWTDTHLMERTVCAIDAP